MIIIVPVSEDEEEARRAVPQMGTPVRFTFHGSAAHVFHKETGVNLETFPEDAAAVPAISPTEEKQDTQPEEAAVAAVSGGGADDPFAEE